MADEVRNAWKGIKMHPSQALELEAFIKEHPRDLESRCKLLGYYSSNRFTDPIGLERFHQHVLFTIKTFPENKIAGTLYAQIDRSIDGEPIYEEAKKLWLEQVSKNPDNAAIVIHAAQFFAGTDKAIADELFSKLQAS